MRIIGGALKGRTLKAPPGRTARPTADRAREALFNVLAHADWAPDLSGARVMDVFAGSGALGFEALSRGAGFCCFVENWTSAQRVIAANAAALGVSERIGLVRQAAENLPAMNRIWPDAAKGFDVVFLDPPYHKGLAPLALAALRRGLWLADDAIAAVEIGSDEDLAPPEGFEHADDRHWGAARVLFLTHTA